MATELNLNTLNWVTLTCPGCRSSVEVLAEDLAIADSIRCPGCGRSITDQTNEDVDGSADLPLYGRAPQDLNAETPPDCKLETPSNQNEPELDATSPLEVGESEAAPEFTGLQSDEANREYVPVELALDDESDEEAAEPATRRERLAAWFHTRRRQLTGTLASIAVHLVLLGVLGLIVFQISAGDNQNAIEGGISTGTTEADLMTLEEIPTEVVTIEPTPNQLDLSRITRQQTDPTVRRGDGEVSEISFEGPAGLAETLTEDPRWQTPTGQGLEGRTAENRAQLAMLHGGNEKSEAAVEEGLKWLIRHQRPDGSWNFRHKLRTCSPRCLNQGNYNCPNGATGMALLCFLGAGYTHQTGPYQDEVGKALSWLVDQSCLGDLRLDLTRTVAEGNAGFYSQGLASIALCEAYGMTKDPALREPAQDALDFIAMSQDPVGGGWRYQFQEPGDTSVVGWQVMAMVSGRMAGLHVARSTRSKVLDFLKHVYMPNGDFGYTSRYGHATTATTSIGVLCTMYLDPTAARRTLRESVEKLSRTIPMKENLYADYYISQILHHFGGNAWVRWNSRMRNSLVSQQLKGGHGAGSWFSSKRHDVTGGRHYSTCMSILILEVYYRHMPLYQEDATLLTIPQVDASE